jgi:hypothetical protein
MNLPSTEELRVLTEQAEGPYVSLYMPTHRKGKETMREDPVRLKNQLDVAEERLLAAGLRRPAVKELLQPAQELVREAPFWEQQSEGLAIFVAPDFFRTYSVPISLTEQALVSHSRFHLKPLLPLTVGSGRFYILALSQNNVRLFHATRDEVQEVDLGPVPQSLAEALALEDPERELQFHTGTTPSAGGVGSTLPGASSKLPGHGHNQGNLRQAIFHGHSEDLDQKDFILRFFHKVDDGISALLTNERAPLVLAGVEYLLPLYREANSYPHLIEAGVTGNPDEERAAELHQAAWPVIEPHFQEAQQAAFEKYYALQHNGLATTDLQKIIPAAYYGAVDTLFVALDQQQWGSYDAGDNVLRLEDESTVENEDVLDAAAIQTFLQDGAVFALPLEQMPDGHPLAAILRYDPAAVPEATEVEEGDGR